MRTNGRGGEDLRPIDITPGFIKHADGSALIEMGDTRVICTAKLEDRVPPFLRKSGKGWITAEYGMLPSSSPTRIPREAARGKVGGRTHEIQRLIGRSLRSVADLDRLGERTVWLDCDVIQADGGTRTASITGAYVALACALERWVADKSVPEGLLRDSVAAVSAGVVDGQALLDLDAGEDNHAEVDMNFVMTGSGKFVEVQGTAEKQPFSPAVLDQLIHLARKGIERILDVQQQVLRDRRPPA
ncbi:MAG: ribonuclease PH [Deltaproteobacteria bacterium]|nr:ribonuclease PH [Deltaproteobacteria bacterium]